MKAQEDRLVSGATEQTNSEGVGRRSIEDLYFFDYKSRGLEHRVKTGKTITEGPTALASADGGIIAVFTRQI